MYIPVQTCLLRWVRVIQIGIFGTRALDNITGIGTLYTSRVKSLLFSRWMWWTTMLYHYSAGNRTAPPPSLPLEGRFHLGAPPENIRDALQKRSVDTNAQGGANDSKCMPTTHDCRHLPLPTPPPTYYRWERLITTATTASG